MCFSTFLHGNGSVVLDLWYDLILNCVAICFIIVIHEILGLSACRDVAILYYHTLFLYPLSEFNS